MTDKHEAGKSRVLGDPYTIGKQPCDNLSPNEDENWFGASQHECPKCCGLRMFCTNCNRDHHKNGWDSCKDGDE